MSNNKHSSKPTATLAGKVLANPTSSETAKKLAGSALSQFKSQNQTSGQLENLASKVLSSPKYSSQTKELAGSVLSQSVKER